MKIISKISDLKREIALQKEISLVPTMGALHEGHLSLIERSVKENSFTIVSIFVNPTQFGPSEDYEKYPRTLDDDAKMCEKAGADIVFVPTALEMYGEEYFTSKETTLICPPYDAVNKLCGKSRPGHFDGVCTVVAKLFNLTKCNWAYFGEKDAQQLFILNKMVKELNFNIEIIPCEIVREPSGLAMSSRNAYLTDESKSLALKLSKALFKAGELFKNGVKDVDTLVDTALTILEPLRAEYIDIVSVATFEKLDIINEAAIMLIAVKMPDGTRLIDNTRL